VDAHGHVLPQQTRSKDAGQGKVKRYGPIRIVKTYGHVSSGSLDKQQDGGKSGCVRNGIPVNAT